MPDKKTSTYDKVNSLSKRLEILGVRMREIESKDPAYIVNPFWKKLDNMCKSLRKDINSLVETSVSVLSDLDIELQKYDKFMWNNKSGKRMLC